MSVHVGLLQTLAFNLCMSKTSSVSNVRNTIRTITEVCFLLQSEITIFQMWLKLTCGACAKPSGLKELKHWLNL